MIRFIFYTLSSLSFFSCNNSHPEKTVVPNQSDTGNTTTSDTAAIISKPDTTVSIHTSVSRKDIPDTLKPVPRGSIVSEEDYTEKVQVWSDSSITLTANAKLDYRIFGYEKPDTSSKKLLLLSNFTSDVEGNPYHCRYGPYYDTYGMKPNWSLVYLSKKGRFIKAGIFDGTYHVAIIYFERKCIEFE